MIFDKIGQDIKVGDFVATAATSYGGAAPTLVVGSVEKISDKGNVSVKQLYLESGKWASGATSFMYPNRRMLKLTGSQLDAIQIKVDMAHATKT